MENNDSHRGSFFYRHKESVFLFLLAFITRGLAAKIGGPHSYHSDEHWIFAPAFKMVREHSWDLDWFRVPPLLIMMYKQLVVALQAIAPTDLTLPGESWFDPLSILPNQFPVLYVGRLMVSFFSSCSVVILFFILRKSVRPWLAFVFSSIYAVIWSIIFYSCFLRPEALVIFFLLCSVFFLMKYQENGKVSKVIWGGVFFGLACASKYNAAFFALSAMLFIILSDENVKKSFQNAFLFIFGSLLAFVISVPQLFWKLHLVTSEISQDYGYYKGGDLAFHHTKWDNFTYYLYTLYKPESFFILFWLFVASILGIKFISKKLKKPVFILMSTCIFFSITYIIFLSQFSYTAERNLTLVYPFLLISSAVFLNSIFDMDKKWLKQTAFVIVCSIGVTSAMYSQKYLRKTQAALPQDHVLSWIGKNVAPNSLIVREIETPLINPSKYSVLYYPNISTIKPESLLSLNPNYLVLTYFTYSLRNDFQNKYPKEFVEWIWSQTPDFEDMNVDSIPLGGRFRIYNFQKLKKDYIEKFKNF